MIYYLTRRGLLSEWVCRYACVVGICGEDWAYYWLAMYRWKWRLDLRRN